MHPLDWYFSKQFPFFIQLYHTFFHKPNFGRKQKRKFAGDGVGGFGRIQYNKIEAYQPVRLAPFRRPGFRKKGIVYDEKKNVRALR